MNSSEEIKSGNAKQRVIKFRAWCAADEMMYYDIQKGIHFNDGSVYEFRRFLESDDYHRWVVMQFTGLLDKNGKEIYEGDCIRFSMIDGEVEVGVVRFSKDGFWTTQQEGYLEQLLSEELESSALTSEVIGHIYSSPSVSTKEDKE